MDARPLPRRCRARLRPSLVAAACGHCRIDEQGPRGDCRSRRNDAARNLRSRNLDRTALRRRTPGRARSGAWHRALRDRSSGPQPGNGPPRLQNQRRRRRGWRRGRRLRLAHRRRLGRRRTRGKQRERIEVPVRVGGQPDAEVDVRFGPFGVAARADRAHDLPFGERRPRRCSDRAEVDERDRVPVRSANRQAEALPGNLPRERDDAARGRQHVRPGRSADVDSAVLAAGVRVVVGDERPQHRAVDRPGPGRSARSA